MFYLADDSLSVTPLGFNAPPPVQLERVSSLNELRESLRRERSSLLLGDRLENVSAFWRANCDAWDGSVIGIASNVGGIRPQFAVSAEQSSLWFIGYSLVINVVDVLTLSVKAQIPWISPLLEFLAPGPNGPLVAIFEIGVLALDWSGAEVWRRGFDDIITSWKLDGRGLALGFFEGGAVSLDPGSGATLPTQPPNR